jgi:hypothetical protein
MRWQIPLSAFLTASMLYFHGGDYLAMLKAARDFSLPPVEQNRPRAVAKPEQPTYTYQWGN